MSNSFSLANARQKPDVPAVVLFDDRSVAWEVSRGFPRSSLRGLPSIRLAPDPRKNALSEQQRRDRRVVQPGRV